MSNIVPAKEGVRGALMGETKYRKMFDDALKEKSGQFVTSLLSAINSNPKLGECESGTVVFGALKAASLDLPIDQNMGLAWLVPYKNSKRGCMEAQFMIGTRGWVQLALRSGQYKKLNAIAVDEGNFISYDPMTEELVTDFTKPQTGKIAGYAAFFELANGYQKMVWWKNDKMKEHAQRFSKSFNNGPWATDYDEMACGKALRLLIKKWGPMSVDIQAALNADQAVVREDGEEMIDLPELQPIDVADALEVIE